MMKSFCATWLICPNLDETTLAFIALTASEEIKQYIARARVVDVVMAEASGEGKGDGEGKKLNIQQIIQRMSPAKRSNLPYQGPRTRAVCSSGNRAK